MSKTDTINLMEFDKSFFESIKTTIRRFRERPLWFFTESDIHSFIQSDMLKDKSKLYTKTVDNINISLVHLEYPTNYRYSKQQLIDGYDIIESNESHDTHITSTEGDRGNFDFAVLNPDFIEKVFKWAEDQNTKISDEKKKEIPANHIINKNIEDTKRRYDCSDYDFFYQKVRYAVEVKFVHPANARNKNMLEEIIKDNEKLRLAYCHSNKKLRPINLVFCSSQIMERKDKKMPVIERIEKYITEGKTTELKDKGEKIIPEGVLNIFVSSFYDKKGAKTTAKPVAFCKNGNPWVDELCRVLGIHLNIEYKP